MNFSELKDPVRFKNFFWPDVMFYDKQWDIIHSIEQNNETYVIAGNKLGKDFVAGFICLWFFLTRDPVRIITTSVAERHLRVLWDEIMRYVQTCKYPLEKEKGGPLVINHMDIRKVFTSGKNRGEFVPISYLLGQVSEKGEKMAGHHAKHTLFIGDEASGIANVAYSMSQGWTKRHFLFGNANTSHNFFQQAVEAGDIVNKRGGYYRRVIRIRGEDSPDVRLAMRQKALGLEPTGAQVIPDSNLLSWDEYCYRREVWDLERQTIGLDAQFYSGPELMLFPKDWLDRANKLAVERKYTGNAWMGVDPAQGGDKTAWAVINEYGMLHLEAKKTPNTTDIPNTTIALMREYNIPFTNVCMDLGGGGKQHADRLRADGFPIRTVAFGESVVPAVRKMRTTRPFVERVDIHDEKYVYVNRRAQMYGEFSIMLDPAETGAALKLPRETFSGFAIPSGGVYDELRRQLQPIPKTWDRGGEGKLRLLPKDNTEDPDDPRTLKNLLGCSPDEADAVVLAVHARLHKPKMSMVGGWS